MPSHIGGSASEAALHGTLLVVAAEIPPAQLDLRYFRDDSPWAKAMVPSVRLRSGTLASGRVPDAIATRIKVLDV